MSHAQMAKSDRSKCMVKGSYHLAGQENNIYIKENGTDDDTEHLPKSC